MKNELIEKLEKRNKQFISMCNELLAQFSIKNKHYGDDFFSGNYEPLERWMSIKRKVARLEAHYKLGQESELPDETIKDTWKDLAIYCIMELMLTEKDGIL
jgi:hypothetical protein